MNLSRDSIGKTAQVLAKGTPLPHLKVSLSLQSSLEATSAFSSSSALNESKLSEEQKKNFYDFAFYANRIVQEVFPPPTEHGETDFNINMSGKQFSQDDDD